jgi:hypothetical protein
MAQCLSFYTYCSSLGVNCYLYTNVKRTSTVAAGWVSDGTTNWTINSSGMITGQAACVVDPYLSCYYLEVTPGNSSSSCYGYVDTYENWKITLLDQFGNIFIATSPQVFNINYYYQNNDDYQPTSGYADTTITVNTGQSEGFGYFLTNSTFPCSYSSECGSCTSYINQIGIVGTPNGIGGECSPPISGQSTLWTPNIFTPNNDGINDTFKIYTLTNGALVELNYASYPNATWYFFARNGFSWYQNSSGGVYVPWNGYKDNNTNLTKTPNDGIIFSFYLNDGTGRKIEGGFVYATG